MTKTRLVAANGLLLLVVVGIGCESPTAASSPTQFMLAGDVRDTLGRFLADVRIQVVEGSHVGMSTMTDAAGRYALPDTFTGTIVVQAEKAGYIPVTQRGPLAGDGRQWNLQFRMVLDAPAVSMTGEWNLILDAGNSCAAVPSVLRTRAYTASVAPPPFPPPLSPPAQSYLGLLRGADFLHPRTYVYIDVAGTEVSFGFPGYWDGDYLLEKLTPSGYLYIAGGGVGSSSEAMASASLRGSFEYCARSDPQLNCEVGVVTCSPFSLTLVRQ
jgi:hypothetical protein